MPPGLEVTRYWVMGDPPSLAGAENDTVAWASPAVAEPIVGAPGAAAGVTEFEALDAAPSPTEFVAVTVKVYATPFVSPVTTIGLDEPVCVMPPGLEVTV